MKISRLGRLPVPEVFYHGESLLSWLSVWSAWRRELMADTWVLIAHSDIVELISGRCKNRLNIKLLSYLPKAEFCMILYMKATLSQPHFN